MDTTNVLTLRTLRIRGAVSFPCFRAGRSLPSAGCRWKLSLETGPAGMGPECTASMAQAGSVAVVSFPVKVCTGSRHGSPASVSEKTDVSGSQSA